MICPSCSAGMACGYTCPAIECSLACMQTEDRNHCHQVCGGTLRIQRIGPPLRQVYVLLVKASPLSVSDLPCCRWPSMYAELHVDCVCSILSEQASVDAVFLEQILEVQRVVGIYRAALLRGGVSAKVTGLEHRWRWSVDWSWRRCRHYHEAQSCRHLHLLHQEEVFEPDGWQPSAVVKRSAGQDVASVTPRGSVVTPGPASFKPRSIACTHA